jgi:hypothetical protein
MLFTFYIAYGTVEAGAEGEGIFVRSWAEWLGAVYKFPNVVGIVWTYSVYIGIFFPALFVFGLPYDV